MNEPSPELAETHISALQDALFQSVTLPQGLDGWVDEFHDQCGLAFVVVLVRAAESGAVLAHWCAGLSHEAQRIYLDTFAGQDLFLMRLPTLPPEAFHTAETVITSTQRQHLKHSRFYQEWLKPFKVRQVAAGWRSVDRGLQVQCVIGLRQAWTERKASLLQPLLISLARAVPIYRHLTLQEFSGGIFGNALDALPMAAFLIDETGQLALQNRLASDLLNTESVLHIGKGELAASIQEESRRLASLVHQAIQAGLGELAMAGEVINITRLGKMPLMLYVMPLRAALPKAQRGAALVLAFDPERPSRLSVQLLSQLFDFTPAEARLAIALCQGQVLAELAEQWAVSPNTLKTQLKSVFAKTGVQRQHQLVTLLLSSPARMLGEIS